MKMTRARFLKIVQDAIDAVEWTESNPSVLIDYAKRANRVRWGAYGLDSIVRCPVAACYPDLWHGPPGAEDPNDDAAEFAREFDRSLPYHDAFGIVDIT